MGLEYLGSVVMINCYVSSWYIDIGLEKR
jgi:hypothetical protein